MLISFLSFAYLGIFPSFWWDEGWTANVARNWVVDGFYGQYNAGVRMYPGLSGALTVVAPAALSFKLFGVGVWQARLPFVLIAWLCLAVVYALGRQIYSRRLAGAAVLILLLVTPAHVGPWLNGRQVLGEVPAAAFFLLGMLFLYYALKAGFPRIIYLSAQSGIFLGLAMVTKSQMLPFVTLSLTAMLLLAIVKRWKMEILVILISLTICLLTWRMVGFWVGTLVGQSGGVPDPIADLYSVTATVANAVVRTNAVKFLLSYGSLALAGTLLAAWRLGLQFRQIDAGDSDTYLIRLGLAAFCLSWLGWYLFMGMYYLRYLVIPVIVGSLFSAELLREWTGDFKLRQTLLRFSGLILRRQSRSENWRALGAAILVSIALALNLVYLFLYLPQNIHTPVEQVAAYIQENSPPDALIESYDSELFFVLGRPYHYPPDQLHIPLIQRSLLNIPQEVQYDPLVADPDYLVLGSSSRTWQIYDLVIAEGEFRLVKQFNGYEIYARVRGSTEGD